MSHILEAAADRAAQMRLHSHLTYLELCRVEDDEAYRREAQMRDDFLALSRAGDLSAPATFAAPVLDHPNRTKAGVPTRPATLLDVLQDAVDYDDFTKCLFAVLLKAARVDGDAQELIERMASKYASMNSDNE